MDRQRAFRASCVTLALLAAVAGGTGLARASSWDVSLDLAVDGAPVRTQFRVELADPSGSTTVNVGGVPVVVSRTPDGFSLSVNTTLPLGCLTTLFLAGGSAIQTATGNSLAAGAVSGGRVQSCSSAGPLVQTGVEYFRYLTGDSYVVLSVPVYGAGSAETIVLTAAITGSFTASSAGVLPPSWVDATSGDVFVTSPLTSRLFTPGTALGPGALVQTGATGTVTLQFRDGGQMTILANTQVTLLPAPASSGVESLANVIRGKVRITTSTPGTADAPRPRLKTPNASVATIGTDFSTEYTQAISAGSSVVEVQQGLVEVTNRLAQKFTLAAGVRAAFDDLVPRVTPVLPIDQGELVTGVTNTFFWTRFPGATRYLFEFTTNPFGFARANSPTLEFPASTVFLGPGTFTESGGLVQLPVSLPVGFLPGGTRVFWRVYPAEAGGQVMAGSTASDTSVLTIR